MLPILRLIRYKNLIIIALLQVLIRYGLIIPILNHFGYEAGFTDKRFIILVISTLFLAASGYVINDYFDIKIDRINRPDKMVIDKKIKRREAMFLHVIFTFCGVFMGLFLSYVLRKESYALMYILIPAFLWYYSTTFKKQGLIGNIIVSALIALVAILVVSAEFSALYRVHGASIIESEACSTAWFWTLGFAFFAFVVNLTREIIKDLEDMEGDEKEGCHTVPITLGVPYTKAVIGLLTIFILVVIWLLYYSIDRLADDTFTFAYFMIFITLPLISSLIYLFKISTAKGYHQLSTMYKLIMFFGVLYVFVAGQLF
ncbi:geranylgeranylglycerol-phosphate geranylgeranyltransferase [Saccharicrinis aurantiacus]|uniref:geranylgeranylglycerol-phosphate geranylgeranyltransferase n=1 Tax=Saccharicrinis aurantiacus TaxID=1849719 RepID=UPI00249363E4|nr:geranylgeranylglycerol-phosphate geranylgeranyltransferase [Saccharicrinis aurantiacus]